ncbi:MAG TPA: hypothetical protein PKW82_07420, partial [Spirochaetales bacterium]|nr:hypothetical protein [Spirochaetales bacterium]
MAVVLIAGALLGAVSAIPANGFADAFKPAALAAGMADSLPWAVSLCAWYLAIVSARRIKSRLASHALVFSISALFMTLGLSLVPLAERPALAQIPTLPQARRFQESGGLTFSAEAWSADKARGLLVVNPSSTPRIAWFPEAAWKPDEGVVQAGSESYRLADATPASASPHDAPRGS